MTFTTVFIDVIGVATIVLLSVVVVLGIICIYRSLYFQIWIRRSGFPQLSYFNGPWLTRVTLSLMAIWWSFGEVVRLTFLNGNGRLFSDQNQQKEVCNFYILSNLGVAEPCMYLLLAFLLYAALQRRESGTLSRRWNIKTIGLVALLCSPSIALELAVVFFRPGYVKDNIANKPKIEEMLSRSHYISADGTIRCTYPLISTSFLAAFYVIVIGCTSYFGISLLGLVINNALRYRIIVLILAIVLLLPLRATLLGFSVLPSADLSYEAIVFASFVALLICTLVGIVVLVYFPVADTFALGDQDNIEMEALRISYDDQ